MAKFFRFPFAATGTKTAVPDAVQTDGSVSYPTGWGVDYERNPVTDPAAKLLPRPEFNQVMFDITDALRVIQMQGSPDFITAADNGGSAFAYQIGAIVRFGGKNWVSQIANNTQQPAQGSAWRELNAIVASDYAASQAEADAGTTNDKYVTPGVLRGGVRSTILTGLSTVSGAAVVATDTVLSAIGKLQKRTADLDASRVKSVNAGTNITVDNTDPLNPIISAPGSDVPNAPIKTNPVAWGDLAVITDSEDGNTLKRATFLNIRNALKVFFDNVYVPFTGGVLSGNLTISRAAAKLLIFARADGTTVSRVYADADGGNNVLAISVASPDFSQTRYFVFNGDGRTSLPGELSIGGHIRIPADASLIIGSTTQVASNGNLRGSVWGAGGVWLSDYLNSANTLLGAYAFPRRSDGGKIVFEWNGQGGTPPWVWGGTNGTNMYVYSPANFSVNYANSANWANGANYADRLGPGGWTLGDVQWAINNKQDAYLGIGSYTLAESFGPIGSLAGNGLIAGGSLRGIYGTILVGGSATGSYDRVALPGTWRYMGSNYWDTNSASRIAGIFTRVS